MDEAQRTREARKLVAKFAEQVPEDELESVYRGACRGDRTAIPALAEILVRERVAVTPEWRRRLVDFLRTVGAPVDGVQGLPEAETGDRRSVRELARQAHEAVSRLAPKLNPQWAKIISDADGAGEWRFAVTELAAMLAHQGIPVDESDRDDLRRLLIGLGESTEDVDRLRVARKG